MVVPDDIFREAKSLYLEEFSRACPTATDLLALSADDNIVGTRVNDLGKSLWEVTLAAAGTSTSSLQLVFTASENDGADDVVALDSATNPQACYFCGNCSSLSQGALSQLAQHHRQKYQHSFRGDESPSEREFGLGDNFHETVMPRRTAEDHKSVLALSEALVHTVAREQGLATSEGQSNLITNGNFEDGQGSPYTRYSTSDTLKGWNVLKGDVEVGPLNTYKVPVSGTSMMHLCGTGGGAISQQFRTSPGTRYQISLAVAGNPQVPTGQVDGITMTVASGTTILLLETYSPYVSYRCAAEQSGSRTCWQWKYVGFQRKKKSFIATANITEIKFSSQSDKENCAVLDDVWVTLPPYSDLPSEFNYFADPNSAKCWFPAYNQGKCGSCWAFASVGALEKQYCARSKGLSKPSLSREMLVRCSTRNNACGGGNADMAYGDLMEIGGLWQTKCLPYQGEGSKHCPAFAYSWFGQDAAGKTGKLSRIDQEMQSRCDDLRRFSNRPPIGEEWELPFTMIYIQRVGRLPDYQDAGLTDYRRSFAKARRHDNIPSWWLYGEEAMMAALNKYGALYGSFKVYDSFKSDPPVKRMCTDHCWAYGQAYGEDGFTPTCGDGSGHAIQIIGYGSDILETEEEVKYWLIENSWGTDGHMSIFGSEPSDPFSYGYPTGAGSEEKCVLAVGASAKQQESADGFELLIWIDGKPFKKTTVTKTSMLAWELTLESGMNHSVTFEIYAKSHIKRRGIDIEAYSIFMPMLRCRGKGFRKDFLKDIDSVQLSWNKLTRKELIAKADEVLRQAGININTTVDGCPSICRTGRFSSTHPCVDYLTSWGMCSDSSYYASLSSSTNCTLCDQEKALLVNKGLMVKMLPSDTYTKWFLLINEALTAPDEPGWNKFGGTCAISTAGHNNHSRLNATYSFFVAQRTECSAAQTAPIANIPGSAWARPAVGAPIPLSSGRTVPCPSPLGGNVELWCSGTGVLSVKSHTCLAQGGMKLGARGYYKFVRGSNYLGIESGAAFAIAELGVSSDVCPTKSWSRWSLCNATAVCEKGFQFRSRVPREPLTKQSPECGGVAMTESRPCMRPGFCPEVLTRFSSTSATSPAGFLAGYLSASTSLPLPTAGAHILRTIYPPCEELRHWCSVISGNKECTTLFQGQIHIPAPGAYVVEFVGSTYGMGSSVLTFSPDRGTQAVESHNFRVEINKPMEVWTDKGEMHRRRRAGKGGSEWQPASEARFPKAGKYMASLLLSGYRDCPTYTVKLHNRDAFKPAVMPPLTAQIWPGSLYSSAKKARVYSPTQTWKLNATQMYSLLGLNQYNPTLTSSVTIKGKTFLPGPGKYKVDLRVDMRCKKDNAWMYCNDEDNTGYRRRRRRWDSYGRADFTVGSARQSKSNCDNCIVSHLVDTTTGQVNLEIELTGPKLAGKRIAVGLEDGKQLYDTIPVADKRVLPNWLEVVWSKYDSTAAGTAFHSDKNAVDMGAEIKYESDIEIVKGEDLARITWPDRDTPLANEYQVQPFNATPPGLILLGKKQVMGFVAEAEGRVDAGACLSLTVEAADLGDTRKGELKGFGLSVCDIDGDRQYLSLTRSNHGNEVKDLAWVHVEFQHPTRLRVMRDISKKTVSVAYRPDNRAHWASVWDDLNMQLNLTDAFFSGLVDVGVSMSTERAYRWSEFYNISIDECPTNCASLDGQKILRCGGKITTPCGDVLDCSAPCSHGGSCVESYCFTCPPENATHKSWACGTREEVCTNDDGQIFENKVPVGAGCNGQSFCGVDHTCKCLPETADSLRAVGYQCGDMPDNCGSNVTLGQCNFEGMDNSQCQDNMCTCNAEDLTSEASLPVLEGWNCGTKSDGCGNFFNFGADAGMCPAGEHCSGYKCCTPATYPSTYECGKAYDPCMNKTTEFHGAMTNWKLMIKQTKGEWTRGTTYFRNFGKETDSNYVNAPANYYYKDRMAKNLLDENNKLTFKMVLRGANMPAVPIIWKQLDFPARAWCSGSAVAGFQHVSGPELAVSDGWGGLCYGSSTDAGIWSSTAKSSRRRRDGDKRVDIMQKTGAEQGITTPYGKADALEIYIAELPPIVSGGPGGLCPLPNDKCSDDHRCVCTKSPPVTGAECGIMNDGCGGTYTYPSGGSAQGDCQSGFACNSTTYKCEKAGIPSIESLRKCMKNDVEGMSKSLSNFFAMSDGTQGSSVRDGGRDMYDGGLKLRVKGSRQSSHLTYTNQCDATWKSTGVDDIEYFTCKMNSPITVWFAGFRSASTKIKGLQIEGNLGADGRGSVTGGKTKMWPHGILYGYYKEVYGTSDPSVNHLVMVPEDSWSNTFPKNTDDDQHTVEGKETNMLFYMNFAGHKGSGSFEYTSADYEKVMDAVVSSC
eukprot:TRINITY_DN1266_c0_g1_i1.p1 TRINITY_DN1266_c0_g1~~TRINITY_DN1266_c0_g1_i1.p1  ORF type:complete len:2583 (-),score=420.51 TRINITY_DN1266_c0_g1_i1:461-7528(-)